MQATLEAAQEAMMEQAEEMRKLTAERDALQLRLLSQAQASPASPTELSEDQSMIAASYDTERKVSRPLSSKSMLQGFCVMRDCFPVLFIAASDELCQFAWYYAAVCKSSKVSDWVPACSMAGCMLCSFC